MTEEVAGLIFDIVNQKAVLLDDGDGGFFVDFIKSFGSQVALHSGRVISSSRLRSREPGASLFPGKKVSSVYISLIHSEVWKMHLQKPGHRVPRETVQARTRTMFWHAKNENWVVAGYPEPITAQTMPHALSLADQALLDLDWINDLAKPRDGLAGTAYARVRFYSADEWTSLTGGAVEGRGLKDGSVPSESAIISKPSRKPTGLNYATADAPLVQQMHQMIIRGKATNPTDAARALANCALGATQESKMKRLLGRYTRLFRSIQP